MEPVLYCRDGSGNDRYFLGAARHFVSGGGTILFSFGFDPLWIMRTDVSRPTQTATVYPPLLPARPVKIPRPPNAYILYRKERHNMVKDANPGITNNEICEYVILYRL